MFIFWHRLRIYSNYQQVNQKTSTIDAEYRKQQHKAYIWRGSTNIGWIKIRKANLQKTCTVS